MLLFTVLSLLALVCSTCGTAGEQTADTASKHAMRIERDTIYPYTSEMRRWANVYSYTHTQKNLEENNEKKSTENNVYPYKDVTYRNDVKPSVFKESREKHTINILTTKRSSKESAHKYKKRIKRDVENDPRCTHFSMNDYAKIMDPHADISQNLNYYSKIECIYKIEAKSGEVIKLTFIDKFNIEYHSECAHDYLEIRDGEYGFSKLLGRFCGDEFPPELTSSGPYMWLKFKSDETIENIGFTIKVNMESSQTSYFIPASCYYSRGGHSGDVKSADIDKDCKDGTKTHALEALWTITTGPGTDIYLDNLKFQLAFPNNCNDNLIQVFGEILEEEEELARFCGSVAAPVYTKVDSKNTKSGNNKMHVRMYFTQRALTSNVTFTYTAFRSLDPDKETDCQKHEFDCMDNICIHKDLRCNNYENCRLKADEDPETCKNVQESLMAKPEILKIFVVFCLILSGMCFLFLYKCLRKFYEDHKIIKEHLREAEEDILDQMTTEMLSKPKSFRDQPRSSLDRDNLTNELFKQPRSVSQHQVMSQERSVLLDSQENQVEFDEEPWRREVESVPDNQEAKARRSDTSFRIDPSRKEKTLPSKKENKEETRDEVATSDMKELGCQTRESLFLADFAPSSNGSNNGRAFSTFGYSRATLVRPSPPPASTPAPTPAISSVQIELLQQTASVESARKPLKDPPNRRPMSAETTRSAPDVIIVPSRSPEVEPREA